MTTTEETASAIVEALRDLIREEISLDRSRRKDPEWASGRGAQDASDNLADLIATATPERT
jgi:hypothetical protein